MSEKVTLPPLSECIFEHIPDFKTDHNFTKSELLRLFKIVWFRLQDPGFQKTVRPLGNESPIRATARTYMCKYMLRYAPRTKFGKNRLQYFKDTMAQLQEALIPYLADDPGDRQTVREQALLQEQQRNAPPRLF